MVEPASRNRDIIHNPGRLSHDERMLRDVPCDDSPGRNHAMLSQCRAADDRRVGADTGAVLDFGRHNVPVWNMRSGIQVIGECHVRPDEYLIAHRYATIDQRAVLNLAAVADRHVRVDVNADPDVTSMPNSRAFAHFCPVPYRRPFADLGG